MDRTRDSVGAPTRRTFLTGVAAAAALPLSACEPAGSKQRGDDAVGPMVGEVTATTASLWFRPATLGAVELRVFGGAGERRMTATAAADRDGCLQFDVDDLSPATAYRYRFERDGVVVAGGDDCRFTTAPADGATARVRVVFGSCADSVASPVWTRIGSAGCDLLVLLGDTPYVDGKKLRRVRASHREFLRVPELAALLRRTPMIATFDDNDCGGVDANPEAAAAARQAFVEHRAMRRFGDGRRGVYHHVRFGPVEVFLIDTRSFADRQAGTLLGRPQREWLQAALKASTAPFKVLASGRVWNEKEPGGADDWTEFRAERDALFAFVGRERIDGCVLVGGDIHVSRAYRHRTAERSGYDLHQFVASPLHDRVNRSRHVPHPELLHGTAAARTFVRFEFDTTRDEPQLTVTCLDAAGRTHFEVTVAASSLCRGK